MHSIYSLLATRPWSPGQSSTLTNYYQNGLVRPYELVYTPYDDINELATNRRNNPWLGLNKDSEVITVVHHGDDLSQQMLETYKNTNKILIHVINSLIWARSPVGTIIRVQKEQYSTQWVKIIHKTIELKSHHQSYDLHKLITSFNLKTGQRLVIMTTNNGNSVYNPVASLYRTQIKSS